MMGLEILLITLATVTSMTEQISKIGIDGSNRVGHA